jgi:L-ascorbate metabolism protein UlaG (beta-lactamase superfamily)
VPEKSRNEIVKKFMLFLTIVTACSALGIFLFLHRPEFGGLPAGARLERIKLSPHYRDGEFRNLVPTPMAAEGVSRLKLYRDFFFAKMPDLTPSAPVPSVRTNLRELGRERDFVVWFGHSSCLLLLGGRTFLIDPVFSGHASPFSFSTRAFPGTTGYLPDDMPDIDYLVISHDHWDHLDHPTVTALRGRVGKVVCPLGVGEHFERWGFRPDDILEGDWHDAFEPEPGLVVHVLPARHFSGRDLRSNRTLWASYAFELPGRKIFYSGDSGYGPHFADIGRRFGGFDLAILENGQYDVKWPYVHMLPEDVARAAGDLGAAALLPVHAGKFCIGFHPWNEPFRRIVRATEGGSVQLLTPVIGEAVPIPPVKGKPRFWWEEATP